MTLSRVVLMLSLLLLNPGCATTRSKCGLAKPNPYATVTGKQRRPRDASCRVCPPVPAPPPCAGIEPTELSLAALEGKVEQDVWVQGFPRVLDGCTEVSCGCACCDDCDGVMALSAEPSSSKPIRPLSSALVVLDGAWCQGDDDSSCCSIPGTGPIVARGRLTRAGGEYHLGPHGFVLAASSLCRP